MQAKLDSFFISKIEQSPFISFPLCIRFDGNAVNQQIVAILFQDSNPSRLSVNL